MMPVAAPPSVVSSAGDEEDEPRHDGERTGDGVQVEQPVAELEAPRGGVVPGQAEPGQDDDDGREERSGRRR